MKRSGQGHFLTLKKWSYIRLWTSRQNHTHGVTATGIIPRAWSVTLKQSVSPTLNAPVIPVPTPFSAARHTPAVHGLQRKRCARETP
jgi:hypothetical protein